MGEKSPPQRCDIIVVGGGTAAFEAAIAARQYGADHVVMLEKAQQKAPRRSILFKYRPRGLLRRATLAVGTQVRCKPLRVRGQSAARPLLIPNASIRFSKSG
jgi:NADPH-dependent glutamate synthase beta subunit-like oxidoreductase